MIINQPHFTGLEQSPARQVFGDIRRSMAEPVFKHCDNLIVFADFRSLLSQAP